MSLKEKLNHIRFRRAVRKAQRRYSTSGRGDCLIVYFINKYLNDKDDYNATYEQIIEDKMQDSTYVNALKAIPGLKGELDEYTCRKLTAHKYISLLMMLKQPKDRESYYNLINDKKLRFITRAIVEMQEGNKAYENFKKNFSTPVQGD